MCIYTKKGRWLTRQECRFGTVEMCFSEDKLCDLHNIVLCDIHNNVLCDLRNNVCVLKTPQAI